MDKLEGLKEGDAVEVTFRGVVDENPTFKTLYVLVEKGGLSSPTIFTEEEINAPSFSIKKVEPPLQPGDKVQTLLGANVVVLAVDSGEAWVRFEGGATEVLPTNYLVRA